jgi:hypothetical protein
MKYLNEYVGGRKAAQEGKQPISWVRALDWQKRDWAMPCPLMPEFTEPGRNWQILPAVPG